MPKFTVADTITFSRTWKGVVATDEERAIGLIMGASCNSTDERYSLLLPNGQTIEMEEEQIDNTVYTAEEEKS